MNRTWIRRAIAALMVVTLGAGCSSAATPAPASQTPAPASQTPAPASQTPAQQRTLGIVDFSETSSMSHMYSLSDQKIFQAAGWQTVMLDPNGDITKANTLCQQLVQRKVDVIITDVFLPSEMALCLTTAKSAGIPVFGNSISLAAGITGGAINTFTATELNDRFIKDAASLGITDLLEIDYHAGAPCLARTTSLDAMLASHPEIKVTAVEVAVPGQVQSAQDFTKAFLTSHPAKAGQGLGIWACWSEPAFGSLAAIKQLGRTDSIPIWTWDISQATLDPIRTGQIAAALTSDTVGMANQMLGMVNGYLKSPSTWQPQEVSATSFIVDKATLDQFLAQHADIVTP